VLPLYVMDNT